MEFIIPLAITLVVGSVLVLLIVGLVAAPWPILLLLLTIGLVGTRRIIQSNLVPSAPQKIQTESQTAKTESVEASQPIKKKVLVYRGASYQHPSLVSDEVSQIEISGKYRGSVWKSTQKLFVQRNG